MAPRKLTCEQQDEILEVFKRDRIGARDLAESLGLTRGYPGSLAYARGIVSTVPPRGYLRKIEPKPKHDNDKRWQWAIERGPIVI